MYSSCPVLSAPHAASRSASPTFTNQSQPSKFKDKIPRRSVRSLTCDMTWDRGGPWRGGVVVGIGLSISSASSASSAPQMLFGMLLRCASTAVAVAGKKHNSTKTNGNSISLSLTTAAHQPWHSLSPRGDKRAYVLHLHHGTFFCPSDRSMESPEPS